MKKQTRRRRLIMLAGLVAIAAISGCIFDTREAEPPDDGTGSTWVVPNTPQNVFTNMRNGLEDLSGVNYKRSIQDVFECQPAEGCWFVPLQEDLNNPTLAGAFDNWTSDVEKDVTDRLLADALDIDVKFTNIEQTFNQTPFVYFNLDYELRLIDTSSDTTFYKGKAEFRMQDGSKGWQLFRWQDIERVSGFASWGFLRGTRRQL